MSQRRFVTLTRRIFHNSRLLQIGLVLAFWLVGEAIVRTTGLPLPGGIVGLALMLVVLATKGMSLLSLKRGADWFLADMLLFFVPAVPAVLDHREFLGLLGVKVFAIILVSTSMVMMVTALTVELSFRLKVRHAIVSARD